jgi:hypothetical protein
MSTSTARNQHLSGPACFVLLPETVLFTHSSTTGSHVMCSSSLLLVGTHSASVRGLRVWFNGVLWHELLTQSSHSAVIQNDWSLLTRAQVWRNSPKLYVSCSHFIKITTDLNIENWLHMKLFLIDLDFFVLMIDTEVEKAGIYEGISKCWDSCSVCLETCCLLDYVGIDDVHKKNQ